MLLLAGLGYWAAQIVFRVETPQGTLIVKTDDPDVQISVKSGGKEVVLFFPKQKKEIPLKVGEYTIELVGGKDGLKLSTNKFEIKSGERSENGDGGVRARGRGRQGSAEGRGKAKSRTAEDRRRKKTFAWPADAFVAGTDRGAGFEPGEGTVPR